MKNVVFHIPSIHNLGSYKSAVRALPDLTAAEEKELAIELQEKNNLESAQKLILSQLKTVVKVAQEYKNYGLDDADLIQEGNIGLMRAVKHFDYTKNVRLYTFSLVWIRSEIQAYVVKNWKMVKIATTKNLKKLFFNYRKLYKEFEHQGIPLNEIPQHIQKALNVDEKELSDIRNYFSGNDLAVDDLTNSDPEAENYRSTPSQLVDYKTPESYMIKYRDKAKEQQLFEGAYSNLSDREKTVIQYRFLTEPQKTHKDISKLLGISSERVRQIEASTIEKLKNNVANNSFNKTNQNISGVSQGRSTEGLSLPAPKNDLIDADAIITKSKGTGTLHTKNSLKSSKKGLHAPSKQLKTISKPSFGAEEDILDIEPIFIKPRA